MKQKTAMIAKEFSMLESNAKRIFLIRHGHCENISQNTTLNPSLSSKGLKQSKYLFDYFNNIPLDIIYTSNLKRAIETTEIMIGKRNINVVHTDLLNELHTINKWNQIPNQKLVELINYRNFNPLKTIDFGETYLNLSLRIISFFEDVIFQSDKTNIAIVGHAEVLNSILSVLSQTNLLLQIGFTFAFAHASISELRLIYPTDSTEYIPQNFCVIQKVNDYTHIKDQSLITY